MEINENAELTLTCPNCGHEFTETVRNLKNKDDITCPKCGTLYDTTDFGPQLEKVLKDTEASLKRMVDDFNRRQKRK